MPVKRSYRRRRVNQKKKYVRKARMYKSPRTQIVNVKRTIVQNIASSATWPQYNVLTMSLGQLGSFSEITELYAQYRINRIKIKWIPAWDLMSGLVTTAQSSNALMYATTRNRSGITSDVDTEGEFLELADGQWAKPITTPRKWYYVPNVLSENYKTAATTGYSPKYKQWLLTSDRDVPHYGFAYYLVAFGPTLTPPASGTNMGRFYITAYMQLKNVK